jgi:hypothetical protein
VQDLVTADLRQVDLVLVFCRDCLVHLFNRLAGRALANIKRSGSRYLLTTTFPGRDSNPGNRDWQLASHQSLCPAIQPATASSGAHEEYPAPYSDKSLGLWKISDIPSF